jgi:hypothetical protein
MKDFLPEQRNNPLQEVEVGPQAAASALALPVVEVVEEDLDLEARHREEEEVHQKLVRLHLVALA